MVVLGVSVNSVKKHAKFAEKYDLPFPLLTDEVLADRSALGQEGTSMSNSTRRAENIERLGHLPEYAATAVAGLTESQLDTPYREGGWTVRQVIHHIADAHLNGFARMKLALTEDRPTLKTYEQDAWATTFDAARHPVRASLGILEGLHARWSTMLEHLPEEAWTRVALHPEAGEMDLDRMLATYAGHGDHHVAQITGLRETRSW